MALLVSECFVKPKYQTEESKQPHYLGPYDLIMLAKQYMQKGLFFTNPPTLDQGGIDSFIENLKSSLSLALVHFYPLAGRLETVKYEDEHSCWVYIDCNKGDGARFIHAKVNKTLSDLALSGHDICSLFELGETGVVNHDGHSRALVSVQVTELVDGLFIGFSMNHSLADATSFWHFINILSEIFTTSSVDISKVPIYKPLYWGELEPIIKLPYIDPNEFITRLDASDALQVTEKIFHFSAESVAKLKAMANAECGGAETRTISSFQSLCALVWKSITKARNSPPDQETSVMFSVNSRPRFDPPLSSYQFGNFVTAAMKKSKVKELLGSGLGSTALSLHQAIATQKDQSVRNRLNTYIKSPFVAKNEWSSTTSILGLRPIVVGGSIRFDMYSPKFGLGRPSAIRSGYGNKFEGKISAQPGYEGAGSVDLSICLAAETISKLESDQEFMSYVSSIQDSN